MRIKINKKSWKINKYSNNNRMTKKIKFQMNKNMYKKKMTYNKMKIKVIMIINSKVINNKMIIMENNFRMI